MLKKEASKGSSLFFQKAYYGRLPTFHKGRRQAFFGFPLLLFDDGTQDEQAQSVASN